MDVVRHPVGIEGIDQLLVDQQVAAPPPDLVEATIAELQAAIVAGETSCRAVVDGYLARKLNQQSRLGALLDPLADKVMLSGIYPCLAAVDLLPWWVALLVIGRDVVIVLGGLTYHAIYGRFDMQPSPWGKASTFLQILFALVLLLDQVFPFAPAMGLMILQYAVAGVTVVSGGHYVLTWSLRALKQQEG